MVEEGVMRQGLKPHSITKRPKHWGSRRHRLQRRPVTCHLLPLLMACADIVPETRPTFTVPGVDRCWSWLVGTERCLPARDTTRDVHCFSRFSSDLGTCGQRWGQFRCQIPEPVVSVILSGFSTAAAHSRRRCLGLLYA